MTKAFFVITLLGLSLVSCKKDFTCVCTVPASGTQSEIKQFYELKEIKKSRAKNACKIAEDTWSLAGGSCELEK